MMRAILLLVWLLGCPFVWGQTTVVSLSSFAYSVNETNASLTIPILDDGLVEGGETFTLCLSNPMGGAGSDTVVTIADNDTAFGFVETNIIASD